MHITRRILVSAQQGDQVPGTALSSPGCPISTADLDPEAQNWLDDGDDPDLVYVVDDSDGDTALPPGAVVHRLPVETSGLEGAFTMPATDEEAGFLTSPHHPLAANGLRPHVTGGGRVHLPAGAVDFLAEECTGDDDGFITIMIEVPLMWIGGSPKTLTPA